MKSIKVSRIVSRIVQYLICAVVAVIIAVPLYISVMGGFKPLGQLRSSPMSIPNPFLAEQYLDLLSGAQGSFWLQLLNSLIVGLGTVLVVLLIGTFAGYALARIRFKLNSLLYKYFQLGLLFPLTVAILPLYIQLRAFGFLDTYIGVILPQAAFQLSMMIMLLRGFIKMIPVELEEAAAMDGYGRFSFLFKIVLPLSTPILTTVGVLTLVTSWNSFFTPLLVFSSQTLYTLPLGVMNFMGEHIANWNMVLAFLTLAMVPAIILYIVCQRYIVAGLTSGAIKG